MQMACVSNSACHVWRKTSPQSLFGWNIGKRNTNDRPQPKYHEVDLPFSTSLVDKTFLRGKISLSPSLSLSLSLAESHF